VKDPIPTPYLSIIIPARNEERHLPSCLESIRVAATRCGRSYEIIVVINRCTDATESIARTAGCRIVTGEAKNLSIIRNAGAAVARGELLVTIDADSRMHPRMLSEVVRLLTNPKVVGGGVAMFPDRWSLGIFCTMLLLLPVALYYRITAGMFFMRRADFEAIGGFNPELVSVEDIDFARRLRALGKSRGQHFATIWRSWIITSTRKFDRFGDWYAFRNPRLIYELFKGKNQDAANKIWYDF
jgi:glycosyltransferase involved in cell wall biosynthesis